MLPRTRIPLGVAALVLGALTPVGASVVTYMDTETLVRLSPVIVRGEVEAIVSRSNGARRGIHTDVTVRVEESLKGGAGDHVTVRLPGGIVGQFGSAVAGTPTFAKGERVLVFLGRTPKGSLTVTGLHQGKYRIEADGGAEYAVRAGAGDTAVVRGPAKAASSARRPLTDLLDEIRKLVRRDPGNPTVAPAPAAASRNDVAATDLGFTLHQIFPMRWFEVDAGLPVTMVFNAASAPNVPGGVRSQFEAALQNWTDVTGALVAMRDGGDTTDGCIDVQDRVNTVSHADPCGQLDFAPFDPVNCSGVLALTVTWFDLFQTKVVNGVTFRRLLDTDIITNDGTECFLADAANYGEVIEHEMGHVLGLGHSCGDSFSPECVPGSVSDDATMRAFAHGDGRGPEPHLGDVNGMRFMYPPPGFIDAKLNGTSFATGETVILTADVNGSARADVYVILALPGGGFIALGASAPNTLAPLAANHQLGFAVDSPLFSLTFTGSQPAGSYSWLTLLVRPGTNPTQPGNWLSADSAPFTFTP